MVVQALKKCDNWEGELATSIAEKNKAKTKFIYLDDAGNNKLFHWLLLSLAWWLMLERRLCVYNAGLKVDTSQEVLTVIMTSYYKNVRPCKRHIAVCRAFCFWQFALPFLGLVTHYCQSWYPHSPIKHLRNCTCQILQYRISGVTTLFPITKYDK